MGEFSSKEKIELNKPEKEGYQKIKPQMDTFVGEAKEFFDNIFLNPKEFYKSYDEKLEQVPSQDSKRVSWEGEKGESKCYPIVTTEEGKACKDKLHEYGVDCIKYNDAEPDFSKTSEATVIIDDMTENRQHNFRQADEKCTEQWNKECKDGRSNWTASDVRDYRRDNKLSWHECCNMKTMELVPREIHDFYSHSGGVAECKARDNQAKGGVFDE